jgi:hypothetical protein
LRIDIIDGIRGHLLIGMLVAHLSFQPDTTWFRFIHHHFVIGLYDAEFFVPVAGFLIGVMLMGKLKEPRRFWVFLKGRLWTIYKYYILSAIPFLLITVGFFSQTAGILSAYGTGDLLLNTVFGQRGGMYSDILPMYFYDFLMLVIFWKIFGVRPELWLAASVITYVFSQIYPSHGFFGLSDFVLFNIAAWQIIFFAAVFAGHRSDKIPALFGIGYPWQRYAIFACLCVATIVLRIKLFYDPADVANYSFSTTVRKQLHPLHLLHTTIAISMLVVLLASQDRAIKLISAPIRSYFALPVIRAIGKYSIQMFVFHVFLMAAFIEINPQLGKIESAALGMSFLVAFVAAPNFWRHFARGKRIEHSGENVSIRPVNSAIASN